MAEKEGFGRDEKLVLVKGVARHEQVGDPGFILEGDEAVALGGRGSLPTDDHAGDAEWGTVAETTKSICC